MGNVLNRIPDKNSTNLMGFIDDGEFYFPSDKNLIHVRSASRMGESDLNLNHRRIEQIRLAMADLGAQKIIFSVVLTATTQLKFVN